jgi:ATP-dependent DNA ligase
MAMRNYRAMGEAKLARCLTELRQREGDAFDRVIAKDEDVASHLSAAEAAASQKGIEVVESIGDVQMPDGTTSSLVVPVKPTAAPKPEVQLIAPMLAYDVQGDFGRVPKEGGWVMEPKFDGWRWQVHVTAEGVYSVGGRNGKRHDGAAPAVDAALSDHVPVGTVLDGEILWEGGESSSRLARFVVFDLLVCNGSNLMKEPLSRRRATLEELMEPLDGLPAVSVSPMADVSEELFENWLALGMEGCVAKRANSKYRPGSRSQTGWLKVKARLTTDAIVTGWELGKGESNGDRCGALLVTLLDTGAETSCGFDTTQEKAEQMVGRIVELTHFGKQPSGKVRHPTFSRTREDLEPVA